MTITSLMGGLCRPASTRTGTGCPSAPCGRLLPGLRCQAEVGQAAARTGLHHFAQFVTGGMGTEQVAQLLVAVQAGVEVRANLGQVTADGAEWRPALVVVRLADGALDQVERHLRLLRPAGRQV